MFKSFFPKPGPFFISAICILGLEFIHSNP